MEAFFDLGEHGPSLDAGPLCVYVAGSSSEREAVAGHMASLRAAGVGVAYDWTTSQGYARPFDEGELRGQAALDLAAVRRADLVWYLAPRGKSEGSATELGAALALGKRVIVSGPFCELGRIFPLLAGERFATHEAALAHVLGIGRTMPPERK